MPLPTTLQLISLSALALALAAPAPNPSTDHASVDYDAIIVGGGPAGLAALSGLARVRRSVLLIDSGTYRSDPARYMHDVLGFDGVAPAYYRWAARQQLSLYKTISMVNGTVLSIEPAKGNAPFIVWSMHGDTRQPHTAQAIVLATGLRDILPETPGVEENWGQGIYWCPWCDGHEHADQPLGILGPLGDVPATVREVLTLNRDIIAFVNGTDTPAARDAMAKTDTHWGELLRLHNVTLENRIVASVERLMDGSSNRHTYDPSLPSIAELDMFRVHFTDGPWVDRAAFLANFGTEQMSNLGEDMGVAIKHGRLAVESGKGMMTNVPGVYAVGDANSDGAVNIPHALFSGKRAAVYLHVRLGQQSADAETKRGQSADMVARDMESELQLVWQMMNPETGDILHALDGD